MEALGYDFLKWVVILSFVMGIVGLVYTLVTFDVWGLVGPAWAGFVFYLLTRRP